MKVAVVAVATVILSTVGVFTFIWLSNMFGFQHRAADEKRLLYQIDHAALSIACERVWQDRALVKKFGFAYPQNQLVTLKSTHPVFPPAIRSLRQTPAMVEIATGTAVRIELGGGFCHYGYIWNPESTPRFGNSQSGAPYFIKQVATNLWFYSENSRLLDAP